MKAKGTVQKCFTHRNSQKAKPMIISKIFSIRDAMKRHERLFVAAKLSGLADAIAIFFLTISIRDCEEKICFRPFAKQAP